MVIASNEYAALRKRGDFSSRRRSRKSFGNSIYPGMSYSSGGGYNKIVASYAKIGSGICNYIGSDCAFIGAGANNCNDGNCGSIIGAGYGNAIIGASSLRPDQSVIGGGECNTISSYAGAGENRINSRHNFIGGGICNCICGANCNAIGGGNNNEICGDYGFIGGGFANKISACNINNVIGGGSGNSISGNCSAILGGSGNTISAGYDWAGVFGCDVTAVGACAFHANTFIAQDICVITSAGSAFLALPPGSLYTCSGYSATTPFLRPVFIK